MSIHAVFRGCIKMWGEVGGVAQNVLTPHFYCIFPLFFRETGGRFSVSSRSQAFFRPRTIRIEAVTKQIPAMHWETARLVPGIRRESVRSASTQTLPRP